jgi:hypothetical protein
LEAITPPSRSLNKVITTSSKSQQNVPNLGRYV